MYHFLMEKTLHLFPRSASSTYKLALHNFLTYYNYVWTLNLYILLNILRLFKTINPIV